MGLSITNLPRENNAKTSAPRRLTGNLLRSGENDNFPGKRREERSLLLLYILFFIRFFLLPLYAFVDSVLQTPTTWKFRQVGMEERFHGNRGFLRNGGIRGFARNT